MFGDDRCVGLCGVHARKIGALVVFAGVALFASSPQAKWLGKARQEGRLFTGHLDTTRHLSMGDGAAKTTEQQTAVRVRVLERGRRLCLTCTTAKGKSPEKLTRFNAVTVPFAGTVTHREGKSGQPKTLKAVFEGTEYTNAARKSFKAHASSLAEKAVSLLVRITSAKSNQTLKFQADGTLGYEAQTELEGTLHDAQFRQTETQAGILQPSDE